MNIRLHSWVIGAVIALSAASTARADISLTLHMTMHSPMIDRSIASMSADRQKLMNSMSDNKIFISGKHYRMGNAMSTVILDADTEQITDLNNSKRTYCVTPADPEILKWTMNRAGAKMPVDGSTLYKIVDTGKTTQLYGHKCQHYIVTMTMTLPNNGTTKIHTDILAAQDLAGVDSCVFAMSNAQIGIHGAHVKGVPLRTITTMSGGRTGNVTIKQEATDISTDPIPSSVFEVPAGYQETNEADVLTAPDVPSRPSPK